MQISDDLLRRLGPLALPFERRNKLNPTSPGHVLEGEDIEFSNHLITIDKLPNTNITFVSSIDEIFITFPFNFKYLWIIDETGLKIIKESTVNIMAARRVVCHTNITGSKKAYQGGEAWFTEKNEVVINFLSGRYGATEPYQKGAVVEYFEQIGFSVYLFPKRII